MNQLKHYRVVAVALGILFVIGIFTHHATTSHALGKVQYKVVKVQFSSQSMQKELDKWSNDGWELVAVEATMGHFIFKK